MFNIRMIVEKHIEMSACFIDCSKACDCKTWRTHRMAKKTSMDASDITFIVNLCWQQITKIRIRTTISEQLKIKRGVG